MNYTKRIRRALNSLAFDNDIIKPLELVAARLKSASDEYERNAAEVLELIIEGLHNNHEGAN